MRVLRGRKACRKCKYIVESKVNECPVCGSRDFSSRWVGFIIVIDESTKLKDLLPLEKEGMYAVKFM